MSDTDPALNSSFRQGTYSSGMDKVRKDIVERDQSWKFDIPASYGDNKIVLMVRDPWTVFSYWEIDRSVEDGVRSQISGKGLRAVKSVLRVYDITGKRGGDTPDMIYEFELKDWAQSWYIHGDQGREWMADIGILCDNGEFFLLARSNVVRTPANRMADSTDDEWMCAEDLYYKMFAMAGGHGIGKSSMEMKEMVERHLKKWLSSGGITSGMFGSVNFFKGRDK